MGQVRVIQQNNTTSVAVFVWTNEPLDVFIILTLKAQKKNQVLELVVLKVGYELCFDDHMDFEDYIHLLEG